MASLSNPKPIKMVLLFNSFSNKATIGILPPERTGIAGTPKVVQPCVDETQSIPIDERYRPLRCFGLTTFRRLV